MYIVLYSFRTKRLCALALPHVAVVDNLLHMQQGEIIIHVTLKRLPGGWQGVQFVPPGTSSV